MLSTVQLAEKARCQEMMKTRKKNAEEKKNADHNGST